MKACNTSDIKKGHNLNNKENSRKNALFLAVTKDSSIGDPVTESE